MLLLLSACLCFVCVCVRACVRVDFSMRNCGSRALAALRATPGVAKATLDFPNRTAVVLGTASRAAITNAIHRAGFSVVSATATATATSGATASSAPAPVTTTASAATRPSLHLDDSVTAPAKLAFPLDGMTCMKNCGTTVQRALRGVDGVLFAVVDYPRAVAVALVPQDQELQMLDALQDAVECVGYGAGRPEALPPGGVPVVFGFSVPDVYVVSSSSSSSSSPSFVVVVVVVVVVSSSSLLLLLLSLLLLLCCRRCCCCCRSS